MLSCAELCRVLKRNLRMSVKHTEGATLYKSNRERGFGYSSGFAYNKG